MPFARSGRRLYSRPISLFHARLQMFGSFPSIGSYHTVCAVAVCIAAAATRADMMNCLAFVFMAVGFARFAGVLRQS